MNAYDEQQVQAFADDVIASFARAGIMPDRSSVVWLGRMQFDAVTEGYPAARAKHLAALWAALGSRQPEPVKPPDIIVVPLPPRDQFFKWVEGKPFSQQTLLDLEPTMNAAGWLLTPPNALGQRTKVKPKDMPWVRVGFGEGVWVWTVQKEDK